MSHETYGVLGKWGGIISILFSVLSWWAARMAVITLDDMQKLIGIVASVVATAAGAFSIRYSIKATNKLNKKHKKENI